MGRLLTFQGFFDKQMPLEIMNISKCLYEYRVDVWE